MSDYDEIAKAVTASANLGSDVVKPVSSFLGKVFGDPCHELSGMITDKLKFLRWKRLLKISDEAESILRERGIDRTRPIPPKIALPILEYASLEDDETLQDLWSALLANAMDPQFNGEVRYGFVDMIRNLTGVDALLLMNIYESVRGKDGSVELWEWDNIIRNQDELREMLGLDWTAYSLSTHNLMRLQCLAPTGTPGNLKHLAIYLTPLGVRFIEACTA